MTSSNTESIVCVTIIIAMHVLALAALVRRLLIDGCAEVAR
jgi:hypothetical protein